MNQRHKHSVQYKSDSQESLTEFNLISKGRNIYINI